MSSAPSSSSSPQQPPSLEILVREPDGFTIWNGPPFSGASVPQPRIKQPKISCNSARFCEDGSRLIVTKSATSLTVYDALTLAEIKSFEVPSMISSALSPRGTFLQTFQKPNAPQDKNVAVWDVTTGEVLYRDYQRSTSKTTWPSFQFSEDESIACRMATNEIRFFDPKDFSKGMLYKLRVPGIAAMELARSPGSHVAVFVPESKGAPASLQLFLCNKDQQSQPVARRSFFRCSTVQFNWNNGSTGLLAIAQSDVDKTNQSYYGESKLNYLTTDGTHEGTVPLPKEGPVHDAQWSSLGVEFAVVYGFMPARATIYSKKCRPLLELGEGPYNTIRWNPKGQLLCLAGFGNLPGDMAFWDFSEKKLLGKTRSECSVTSEWSPDGHYFMTATTAPRLQIDNGIKIFHHNGSLYFKQMFERLYQADWKPDAPENFGDIAEIIKTVGALKIDDPKKGPETRLSSTVNATPAKPAAYRPPHAKNAAAVQQQLFGGLAGTQQEMSKNAMRNKKRREKQKAKKASEDPASPADAENDD